MPSSTLMTKILPHRSLPWCWSWGDLWYHRKQAAKPVGSFQRSRVQSWWRNERRCIGSGRHLSSFFCSRVPLGFPLQRWDQGGGGCCMARLQGVTVLQSPKLKATTVVGAGSGIVTRPVWHLAGLLMGRVTLAGTWQVSTLLCYLSLMLQNHQAWLYSAMGASESCTLKRAWAGG